MNLIESTTAVDDLFLFALAVYHASGWSKLSWNYRSPVSSETAVNRCLRGCDTTAVVNGCQERIESIMAN